MPVRYSVLEKLGNFRQAPNDYPVMDCDVCREIVSARLDGEATPVEVAAAEHHLASCPSCRHHSVLLAEQHRALRVAPAEPVPDLSIAILNAARAGEPAAANATVWRVGLALAAAAQLLTAVAHLDAGHLARDQAAWEAALAAGFSWAAWRPSRTAGLVPVLAVLTVLLLVNGGFAGAHHLLAPAGLALLAGSRRTDRPLRALVA